MLEITIEKVSEDGVREFVGAARIRQINREEARVTRDFLYVVFCEREELLYRGIVLNSKGNSPHDILQDCLTAWRERWNKIPVADELGGAKC